MSAASGQTSTAQPGRAVTMDALVITAWCAHLTHLLFGVWLGIAVAAHPAWAVIGLLLLTVWLLLRIAGQEGGRS